MRLYHSFMKMIRSFVANAKVPIAFFKNICILSELGKSEM